MASQSPDFDVAETTYSVSETSAELRARDLAYTKSMAADLFESLQMSSEMDEGALDQACEALPDLLRAFAQKLGYRAQSAMHRDVMFFVQKNRRRSVYTILPPPILPSQKKTNCRIRVIRDEFADMLSSVQRVSADDEFRADMPSSVQPVSADDNKSSVEREQLSVDANSSFPR